ncbi:MAG: hypothetical protein EBU84_01740 [Actinobacteria bacterium]|nr:hypothetical protein [Actinomycetota bacterium]
MEENGDSDEFFNARFEDELIDSPSSEELAVWLSEFMSQSNRAHHLYRQNLCSIVVGKIFDEFGVEGMCELMLSIDRRAGWISDIIIEDADIQDVMFTTHNVFDNEAIIKARQSSELIEMNKKIWRLRRKYAKLIADEIIQKRTTEDAPGD